MTFTNEEVIESLRKAVASKPEDYYYLDERHDNVSTGCYGYCHADGSPSCIVGHVLYDLVPEFYEEVRQHEEARSASFAFGEVLGKRTRELFTTRQITALTQAQGVQDIDRTWLEALALAIKYLEVEND